MQNWSYQLNQFSAGFNQGALNAGFGFARLANTMIHGVNAASPFRVYNLKDGSFNFSMGDTYHTINHWLNEKQSALNNRLFPGGHSDRLAFKLGHFTGNFLGDMAMFGGTALNRIIYMRQINPIRAIYRNDLMQTFAITKKQGWTLPENGGGALINSRWYSEHALERMAPNTPQVMAKLELRALERAQIKGLHPGTEEFGKWISHNGPKPRGIPPSIIEAEIACPGTTNVKVILNENGNVITVIPRGT